MGIKTRRLADGSERFNVTWVIGGGAWTKGCMTGSETFGSLERAEAFENDVRRAGWRWPQGWVKGQGYVVPTAPLAGQITFHEVAEDFFARQETRIAKGRLTAYTLQRDHRSYELHLAPTFAGLPIDAPDEEDVEDWIERMLELGAMPKSIRNRHGILSAILKHSCRRMKLRSDNPCELSELPIAENLRDIKFLQHGEWALVRSCLRRDAAQICDLLLMTAMRWGEVCAVQIGDCTIVSEDEFYIAVRRAWTKRAVEDKDPIRIDLGENKSWKIHPAPKSRRSRFVTVRGELARELIQSMAGKSAGEYLFTTRQGNPWRYNDFHSDRWAPAVHLAKQMNLGKHVTLHMLRHTAAVWALAEGVPIQTVSEMLGHADIKITWNTYGGAVHLANPEAARALENQMRIASTAILPANMPTSDEIEHAPVRTRPRSRSERAAS